MANPVVHFEVLGNDLPKLRSFYADLFGWKLQDVPEMSYVIVEKEGEGIGGGIGAVPEGGQAMVTFYVATEDMQGALDKAVELGGSVVMPVTDMGVVTIGLFADPEGNVVGIVKPPAEDA